jgi:hypothetical protein
MRHRHTTWLIAAYAIPVLGFWAVAALIVGTVTDLPLVTHLGQLLGFLGAMLSAWAIGYVRGDDTTPSGARMLLHAWGWHRTGHRAGDLIWLARLRLWAAQVIAPAGSDVHNPDESACPLAEPLLHDVFYHRIRTIDGRHLLDVTDDLDDLAVFHGLVELRDGGWVLTDAGERELARRWGPDRVPPWGGGPRSCETHGNFDSEPGEHSGCSGCAYDNRFDRVLDRARTR